MFIEVFVHIAHIEDLFSGKPVNCKINYASQYDMRMLLNTKKFKFVQSDKSNSNLITVKKKRLLDFIKFKRK